MDVRHHRVPQRGVMAQRAIQRGDEVSGALEFNGRAGDAQLVRAVMAGGASSKGIVVIELGRNYWAPSCEHVTIFAGIAGGQMGRILWIGFGDTAIVASEARGGHDHRVGMIKVIDRPGLSAHGVAGGADVGGFDVRGGLGGNRSARQAQLAAGDVAGNAGASHLRVVNLGGGHVPIDCGEMAGVAGRGGGNVGGRARRDRAG